MARPSRCASGKIPDLRLRLAAWPRSVTGLGPCRCASGSWSPSCWCWSSGSGVGLALAGWHARQWLRDELWTAQAQRPPAGGARFRRPAARRSADRARWRAWSATFDGNRHLQAWLVERRRSGDRHLAAGAGRAARPTWFADLLRPDIPPMRLAVPGPDGSAVELRPVYANDTARGLGRVPRPRRWCWRSPRSAAASLVFVAGRPGAAAADGGRPGAAAHRRAATTPPARPSRDRRSSSRWGAGSTRWPRDWPPCASATGRSRSRS